MGENEDMPEEIREWIETMKGVSDGMESFSERPHFVPDGNGNILKPEIFLGEGGIDLDEGTNDPVLFIITHETRYFSGIFDSFRGTGKKQVSFTIDGEERLFEMFKGEIPNIKSVECSEEVPSEHIVLELSYRGRDKEKSIAAWHGRRKVYRAFELKGSGDKGNPAHPEKSHHHHPHQGRRRSERHRCRGECGHGGEQLRFQPCF